MAPLTTKQRNRLPSSAFAYPERRALPIVDAAHVRAAIARIGQTQFPSMSTARSAASRIIRAAKRFGVQVSPDSAVARLAGSIGAKTSKRASGGKKRSKRNPGPDNLSSDERLLERARRLSEQFHGTRGEVIELSERERRLPRYVVALGTMPELSYEPDPSSKRSGARWIHQAGDRGLEQPASDKKPILAVDPETKRPIIVAAGSPMRFSSKKGLVG